MGACASRFSVLKAAADAPPPSDLASREVTVVDKTDAPPADDEAKPQSLGHLFKENKVEKGPAESNDGGNEDLKAVADAPAKGDVDGSDGTKKGVQENLDVEHKTEKLGENKQVETSGADKKDETTESEVTQEQKPTPDAEKKTEEVKPAETKGVEPLEKKPEAAKLEKTELASGAGKNGEEKLAETPETETKAEEKPTDKHVLDTPKTENPSDNKLDVESEEKKVASDAEKPKAEEVKTEK